MQTIPEGSYDVFSFPRCWVRRRPIKSVPKPGVVALDGAGPPVSDHFKYVGLAPSPQLIVMWPIRFDHAPYFTALVASSCTTRQSVLASSPLTVASGPSSVIREGS